MLATKLTSDIAARYSLRAIILFALCGSVAVNFLLAFEVVARKQIVRDVFVPPNISKSFWIDGENLDPDYLEQMGQFILTYYTNLTPGNGEYNKRVLLRYVSPASYGEVDALLSKNIQQLVNNSASTQFVQRSVTPRPDLKAVLIGGILNTYVTDKLTSSEPMTFYLRFESQKSATYLAELRKVDGQTVSDFTAGGPVAPASAASN